MSNQTPVTLTIKGMTCQGCVNSVTKIVKRADPGADVAIDLASGKLEAKTQASAASLAELITKAGYEARPA